MISNRLGTTTAISLVTTCMCTCACMHATHIHHIHTHTYTHAYNTYIYIHIHIHTHTYTHACNTYTSYTYTYIYIHIHIHTHTHSLVTAVLCGTQTDMPRRGACCVQKLDDSQIHADRTTYRTLLRSSSMQEPRDPLLKVVLILPTTFSLCQTPASVNIKPASSRRSVRANVCVCACVCCVVRTVSCRVVSCRNQCALAVHDAQSSCLPPTSSFPLLSRTLLQYHSTPLHSLHSTTPPHYTPHYTPLSICNDPSAGSPTETLLRLLLPLNDQVCPISRFVRLTPDNALQRPH